MTDQDLKDVSREMTDKELFALQKELEGVSARAAEAFASGGVWIEMHLGAEQAVKERLEHPEESVFEMARRLYSEKFPAIAGNPDLIIDAAELQDDVGKAYVGPGREETVSWFLAARLDPRFFSFRMAQEFDEMESYRAGQVTMEYLPDGSALNVLVRACDETPAGFCGRLRSGSCRTDSSGHCSVLKGSYVLGIGRCLPCGSSLEALRISRD